MAKITQSPSGTNIKLTPAEQARIIAAMQARRDKDKENGR